MNQCVMSHDVQQMLIGLSAIGGLGLVCVAIALLVCWLSRCGAFIR